MTPDEATIEWIFDAAAWWLLSFGGFARIAETDVLTPTEHDFPVDLELEGEDLAADYLAFVLEHTRMSDWPFVVELHEPTDTAAILRGMPHAMTSPARASGPPRRVASDGPYPIAVSPSDLEDPVALVAGLARGVSHYHLYTAPDEPPSEERALFVDLGAVMLGFGIFLASSAFEYDQVESGGMVGWGYRRRGALSELDVSYALALVAALHESDPGEIRTHLKANPRAFFTAGQKHIQKKRAVELEALRRLEGTTRGPYR
ncbi:MAG: hypothetical protein AB7S26_12730 [Sandaracinaceae bacterium]